MRQPVLWIAVVVAVLLAAGWAFAVIEDRRRRAMHARLATVLGTVPPATDAVGGALSLRRPRSSTGTPRPTLKVRLSQRLAQELEATGERLTTTGLLLAASVGVLVVGVVCIGFLRLPMVVSGPLVLAAALGTPIFWLRNVQQRFQRQFVDVFPDALDIIVRAVRAGLPVLDAIEAAGGNVPEPVASEFRRLLDELRIGVDLDGTLEHAANRVRVTDFRFFAATLALQRRTGGSLAETLANLAALIRQRKEVRLKARSLSAESRASAYLIGALPFCVAGFMYFTKPDLISVLFIDPRGKVILYVAIALLLLGFALMRTMLKKVLR